MATLDWQKIRETFDQCLQLEDTEQEEFLSLACRGDEVALEEIKSLLDGHRQAGTTGFLDHMETVPNRSGDPRFSPGTIIGPYEIVECVGAGGTGTVFQAKRVDDDSSFVAIKVLQPWMHSKQGYDRFEVEKRTLNELNHPGIAKLLDQGLHNGSPYLVMQFIDGPELDEALESRSVSLQQRITWFRKICEAVAAAHERQILHRDLKPGNILIGLDGNPVVTDFGLAKSLKLDAGESNLTTTGRVMGTPKFMAPEQVIGVPTWG